VSALAAALAMPGTVTRGYDKKSSLVAALAGKTLAEIEEIAIRAAFDRHHGRRLRMMRELGVSKTTLLRKLNALGLRRRRDYLRGAP
jgi:DNA-binding NtrC family response regulator